MKIGLIAVLFFSIMDVAFGRFLPKAFEAKLEQVVFSIVSGKERVTPVTMKYLFPNNIYFDVQGDSPVTYVCNKRTSWKYNPPFDANEEKGEVLVGDSSKYCYVKIFDALSNGLKNNKLYKVKTKLVNAQLIFSKAATAQTKVRKVELVFQNKIHKNSKFTDVKEMNIYYLDKKKPVLFRFQKLNTKLKLTSKDFIFQVPKNTNITSF